MRLSSIWLIFNCCLCCWHLPLQARSEQALQQAWLDLQQLASDDMGGRSPGSAGSVLAQQYLQQRFAQLALQPFNTDYRHPFALSRSRQGVNIIGVRQGCRYPEFVVVVTAHYDHLAPLRHYIYNGADDNASGVSALLYLAALTQDQCPAYSYVFLATDGEELGLRGAKAFLANPPVNRDAIVLNLNLDMVSRGEAKQKIYAAGKRTLPQLTQWLPLTAGDVSLVLAPERRSLHSAYRRATDISWDQASDHAVFRRAGIPFVYIGVGVHRHYHTPDDDWQRIDPIFFRSALQLIADIQLRIDALTPAELLPLRQPK